jgi:hypothetical protein
MRFRRSGCRPTAFRNGTAWPRGESSTAASFCVSNTNPSARIRFISSWCCASCQDWDWPRSTSRHCVSVARGRSSSTATTASPFRSHQPRALPGSAAARLRCRAGRQSACQMPTWARSISRRDQGRGRSACRARCWQIWCAASMTCLCARCRKKMRRCGCSSAMRV